MSKSNYKSLKHRFILPEKLQSKLLEMHPKIPKKNQKKALKAINELVWEFYLEKKEDIALEDNRVWQYFSKESGGNRKHRFGFSVFERAFGKMRNPPKENGCKIEVADLICKYVCQDIEINFKSWLEENEKQPLEAFLSPYYKKIGLHPDQYQFLYKHPSKELTDEDFDEVLETTKGIEAFLSMLTTQNDLVTIREKQDQDLTILKELLELSNLYHTTLATVEILRLKKRLVNIMLEDVYVQRELQKVIIDRLNHPKEHRENELILIEGEAGRGKSSLLWFLMDYFKADSNESSCAPIFIKSTDLNDPIIENLEQKIVKAASIYKKQNKRLILLIDTLDLVLQQQKDITRIRLSLSKYQAQGISIVATSRPREATFLKSYLSPIKVYQIENYSEEELKEAIGRYTNTYAFRYKERIDVDKEYHRVLGLVDHELSLREICYNPLTLRMVYSIYMPNQIPPNINVHKLYNDYWEKKVLQEIRPGDELPTSNENLGYVTKLLALTLILEGKTEVDKQNFVALLEHKSTPLQNIEKLVNRGIIKDSEIGIGFFHQTFLEYSAGKAFLSKEPGLLILKHRVHGNLDNLFLLPSFEQALLQLGDISIYNKALISEEVSFLAQSRVLAANFSAIYVYSQLSYGYLSVQKVILSVLTHNKSLLNRYFELAPNMPHSRIKEFFEELYILWGSVDDEFRFYYFELLFRFSAFDPFQVQIFLNKSNAQLLLKNYSSDDIGTNRIDFFVSTIKDLLSYNFEWTWNKIIDIILTLPSKIDLHIRFYKILGDFVNKNPKIHSAPATNLINQIPNLYRIDQSERSQMRVIKAFELLWQAEWRQGKDEIIFDLCWRELDPKQSLSFQTKLYALASFFIDKSDYDIEGFLSYFLTLNPANKYSWSRAFLLPVLARYQENRGKGSRQLIEFCENLILNFVRFPESKEHVENFKPIIACLKIRKEFIPKNVYLKLLHHEELSNPLIWLDKKRLGELIGPAFWAGVPSAEKAVELIISSHEEGSNLYSSSKRSLLGFLSHHITKDPDFAESALNIFLSLLEFSKASAILQSKKIPISTNNIIKCEIIGKRLIDSDNASDRRQGWELFMLLFRICEESPLSIQEVISSFYHENDFICKKKLFHLVCYYTFDSQVDLSFSFIQQIIEDPSIVLDDDFIQDAIYFMTTDDSRISKYNSQVLHYIIKAPFHHMRVKSRRKYFLTLLNYGIKYEKIDETFQWTYVFLKEADYSMSKSGNAIKELVFSLKSSIKQLFHLLTKEQKKDLLLLIPEMHSEFAFVLVDLAFGLSHMEPDIENLLRSFAIESEKVDSEVKLKINHYLKLMIQPTLEEDWPELREYILQF